jgi:CheY-like chemotaxis protein
MNDKNVILLVDDSFELRVMMKALLNEHNFHVVTAENGHKALQIIPSLRGQQLILITDYSMPIMSGEELIMSLEKMQEHPCKFIFLISGLFATDPNLQNFLMQKISVPLFYYQKPFNIIEIINKLKLIA